jgi:hypothetical protein
MELLDGNGERKHGEQMPNIVLFAPCENLIVSQEQKISLISILETINIGLPANQVIPPNASLPLNWFTLALWEKVPSDQDKEFECYTQAAHVRSNPAKFKMATTLHKVVAQILGFPLALGPVRVKLCIREVGVGDFRTVSEYPLAVQRAPNPAASPSAMN